MLPTSDATPLERRPGGQILIPGLACLVCLAMVIWQSIGGNIGGAAVPLLLMVVVAGAWGLYQAIAKHRELSNQVSQLAQPAHQNRVAPAVSVDSDLGSIETRLDESLRNFRQTRFHRYLNTLPDGMALCGQNGEIEFANDSLRAVAGVEDDLSGQLVVDILKLDRTPGGRDALSEFEQNTTRNVVVEFQKGMATTDGVLRVARHPVCEDGQVEGYLWSVRDITQQTLAEEMREHFVSSATHELRTPLANIRAYAETLLMNDDIDLEQEKAFINTINSEASRLSRFVDDLLNVSQMQAGSLTLDRNETDIERLTMEVEAKIRPLMNKKDIEFELLIPPKLPKLSVDKDKLSGALVNLLGNAAKYTPTGGNVKFLIDVNPSDIQFHIEDSGIGIAEDEVGRVFERFFRSDDRRVRDEDGNGLGLTFTHDVVRLHGGRLDVHSELNKGSRFTLQLPISSLP